MRVAVISVTRKGNLISRKIAENISADCDRYVYEKIPDKGAEAYGSMRKITEQCFAVYDGIVFVCACGIAVRMIAPYVASKLSDPAVIAVDEGGRFAVSLLSGHIGKANALTERIAEIIGATAVITTATDVGGKFSPDSFAVANNLHICEYELAKLIAAEIIDGGSIGFYSDFECKNVPDFSRNGKLGICISHSTGKAPFEQTLHLVPRNVVVGVGCRKNTDTADFERFVISQLEANGLSIHCVSQIGTIDLKKDERAILSFAEKYEIPLNFYSSEQLANVKGEFDSSDFVAKITGVDNVCERSAMMCGKRLTVKKQAMNGMTFAAAEMPIDIDFDRRVL